MVSVGSSCTMYEGKHTCYKTVADKVLGRTTCKEDVGFVEKENGLPFVGKGEVLLQLSVDVLVRWSASDPCL